MTTRGAAAPAPAHSPAGYEPEKLDGHLRSYLGVCERSARIAESLAKKAEDAVKNLEALALQGGAQSFQEADEITKLHERLTKANLNLVKALDELSRLRSFLAGGPDSRPELASKSEVELRALVLHLAPALGFKLTPIVEVES